MEPSKDIQPQLECSSIPSSLGRSGIWAAPELKTPLGKQSNFLHTQFCQCWQESSRRVSSPGQENSHLAGGSSLYKSQLQTFEQLICPASGEWLLPVKVVLSKALWKTLLSYPEISLHFPHSSALAPFLIMQFYHWPQRLGSCTVLRALPLSKRSSSSRHCCASWSLTLQTGSVATSTRYHHWLPGSVKSCQFCSSLPVHFCSGSKLMEDPLHCVPLYLLNGYSEQSKLYPHLYELIIYHLFHLFSVEAPLIQTPLGLPSFPIIRTVIGTLWSSQLSAPLGWVFLSLISPLLLQMDSWQVCAPKVPGFPDISEF